MSITLLQLTDTHIHDQQNELFKKTQPDTCLQKVMKHAKQNLNDIDYVVVTGDLTHEGTEAACTRLANLLSQFDCPVYVTPGNHDSNHHIRKYLLNKQIDMPGNIKTEHWQLLFTDSHIENQAAGLVTDISLKKLNTQLQQCNKPALLFTHHPPVKINSLWLDKIGMSNGDQLLQQLSSFNQLQAVVFGHIHQTWQSQYQHIKILGTPSTCIQFKAGSEDFATDDHAPGYRVFQLHENGQFTSNTIYLDA
jgi:3',5'-cyclic-AMP phosphodiesterase